MKTLIKWRHNPIEHIGQVKQHVLHFIFYRESLFRVHLGLPVAGDRRTYTLQRSGFLIGCPRRVKAFNQPAQNHLFLFQ